MFRFTTEEARYAREIGEPIILSRRAACPGIAGMSGAGRKAKMRRHHSTFDHRSKLAARLDCVTACGIAACIALALIIFAFNLGRLYA